MEMKHGAEQSALPAIQTEQDAGVLALGNQVVEQAYVTPAMSVGTAKHEQARLEAFVKEDMTEGVDYGTVFGIKKPFLFKPGAEKLLHYYGLIVRDFEFVERIEDFDAGLFVYTLRCNVVHLATDKIVGEGLGNANSYEPKYRYLWIPKDKPEEERGKHMKATGEGRWRKDFKTKAYQWQERFENPDRAGLINTLMKMAKKRCFVDGGLTTTRASGVFSQDKDAITQFPSSQDVDHPVRVLNPEPHQGEPAPSAPKAETAECETQPEQPARATTTPKPESNERMASEKQIDCIRDKWDTTVTADPYGVCSASPKQRDSEMLRVLRRYLEVDLPHGLVSLTNTHIQALFAEADLWFFYEQGKRDKIARYILGYVVVRDAQRAAYKDAEGKRKQTALGQVPWPNTIEELELLVCDDIEEATPLTHVDKPNRDKLFKAIDRAKKYVVLAD